MKKRPEDLITTTEARQLLRISALKMARLIKEGAFKTYENPLDKRFKLISRKELEPYMQYRKEAA